MYKIYKDLEDSECPYLAATDEESCWFTLRDLERDLLNVWANDKDESSELYKVSDAETRYEYLGEYDDLNVLKVLHLVES